MTQSSLNVPNLDRLISHMEGLRQDQFDMGHVFRDHRGKHSLDGLTSKVVDLNVCGTAACIGGECAIVSGVPVGGHWHLTDAGKWLGLSVEIQRAVFLPDRYKEGSARYPLSRALRMLRHLRAEFLRTGTVVVDWDAPEPVETQRKPWAPPVGIGADKPLPAELTRLVREPATVTEA